MRFADAHPTRDIRLIEGPRQGATANFLSLIEAVAPGEALAFCDQDDVWLPHRLSQGVAAITASGTSGQGVLHVTRTTICDEDLQELRPAPLFTRPPSFRNALVQACTPANTMLVDPAGVAHHEVEVEEQDRPGQVAEPRPLPRPPRTSVPGPCRR